MIRSVKPFMSRISKDDLFFLCSPYYIIWHNLGGDSSHHKIIIKIQKRIISVIMHSSSRDSCRELFKNLKSCLSNLSVYFLYCCLLLRTENCLDPILMYITLMKIYNCDLHLPIANLTVFQNGVLYFGIRIFNKLPSAIKDLSQDVKQFKLDLKGFFC
jgi:hypothetical protein